MPKLKQLSGDDVIGIFRQHGFVVVRQRGSHVTLQRQQPTGERQGFTVPKHRELDTGTLRAIVRQASRFIPEAELRSSFYAE